MSMKLTAMAMDVKVGNPLRKLVLLKLCDNANDQGECWPSMQHIADQCEISRRSVATHINALVDAGFLAVVNRGRDGKKTSNLYAINLLPRPPEKPVSSAGDAHLSSAGDAHACAGAAHLSSAGAAHRTSHSLEPVIEPEKKLIKKDSRGTRLPSDWIAPPEYAEDLRQIDSRLIPAARQIADKFRDYWVAVPGAKGVKLDWRATWRNWVRREAERLPGSPGSVQQLAGRPQFLTAAEKRAARNAEIFDYEKAMNF